MPALPPNTLDMRLIAPRRKRLTIAAMIDALAPGESMVLVNDGNPQPLCDRLDATQQGIFEWEFLERGPIVWRVRITRIGTARPPE